jgi:exodeoxyribonuclease V beta subunit
MEFFFALGGMSASSIAAVLSEDDRYAGIADGLRFTNIKGLMRGFIDLVGRKDNRYFIVDYKSNLLGQSRMHYQQQALGESMRAHRYDLQYLIYLVALHRFLKARLGQQYDYERDVAGAYYLFLRGIKPGSDSGIWHDKPSLTLIEKLDACFNGEGVT